MKHIEWLGMHYRILDDDDPRPMNGFTAPPVDNYWWTPKDQAHWEAANRAQCKAFDAWNERHPWIHCMDQAPPEELR